MGHTRTYSETWGPSGAIILKGEGGRKETRLMGHTRTYSETWGVSCRPYIIGI